MNKEQFLNRIRAGSNQLPSQSLEQYFKDYGGPFDDNTADQYVQYFSNNPKELEDNLERGTSHRESLIENGLLGVNSPL